MRYVALLMLIIVLLMGFWPAQVPADASANVGAAVVTFVRALLRALDAYAMLEHLVDEWLWQAMSGSWRPLLGALQCARLLLALWGLVSLGYLRRLMRRVL